MLFSSLVALEVVKMTSSSASSDENFVKIFRQNFRISRVPSRGFFWVLNPHQNHLDPHFIWPWVQWTFCISVMYLEVPGLLVTTLQSCLEQCCKEVQYLLQNKMSTWNMCSASCFNSRESEFAVTNENKITPKDTNILRMYLLNCCFGLNENDNLWQLWVYYQWRAQYVEEPGMMIIEM